MTHDEEIKRLREIGTETQDLNIVNNVIYNLSAYGPKSIPAITEIMNHQSSVEIRRYGTETINKIKAQSLSPSSFSGRVF